MDYDREIERLDRLAGWMDDAFVVPGTRLRFGLDGLAGLIPGVGDTAGLLVSGYLILRAQRMGVPGRLMARMTGNIVADWLVGTIPLVGDLFDFGWKANRRNLRLLKQHFNYPHDGRVRRQTPQTAATDGAAS